MRRSGGEQPHRSQLAKRLLASFVVALFIVTGSSEILRYTQAASAPNVISYQGRILNANGVPISDATAEVIFKLLTPPTSLPPSECVWSNSSSSCATSTARTVTLTDGLFSETLGDIDAGVPYAEIPDSLFSDYGELYLEVTINGEALSPAKRIASAPYALNSDTLDGFNTTQAGGTTAAVVVLDASGNLQLTGNPASGVSSGALYINPAGGDVAANDTLLGIAVGGGSRFFVDAEGDMTAAGTVASLGGNFTSTNAITIASSGGNISLSPNGTGLAYVTSGDDFAVGANSLAAPFSVDEDVNTVRIGDGANDGNDPKIVMYASDGADSGTIAYADEDRFSITGADVVHTGLGTLPTTINTVQKSFEIDTQFTGTSDAGLNNLELFSLYGTNSYSAVENVTSTDHTVAGGLLGLNITGASTTLTNGYGLLGSVRNASTNGSLVQTGGKIAGVFGTVDHVAVATTLSAAAGVMGRSSATAGILTDAYGVIGDVAGGAGTVTNAYGGSFLATQAGTNRYGVYATASGGGGNNLAGYFFGARLHVDDDATMNTPGLATGAGDLYVVDSLEADGSIALGDTTGGDTFSFTSAATSGTIAQFNVDSIETGTGFLVKRAAGNDFNATLAYFQNSENSATSDGDVLVVENQATGQATLGVYIVQAAVSNATNGAGGTTLGSHGLVVDTLEAASDDDLAVFRANGQIVLAIESDGSVLSDNAYSSAGADYAEYFATNDTTLTGGEIVCHDRSTENAVKRCEAGNTEVVGVVSTTPGFIGGLPDDGDTAQAAIVGLTGQIDTRVTAAEGAIAIGDPITQSSTSSGYGAKANGPVRIIGFALEALPTGIGTIKVFVNPQWYGGDMLTNSGAAVEVATNLGISSLGQATSATPTFDSAELALRGSAWTGAVAAERAMSLSTSVSASDDYRLSVKNVDGVEVAYINDDGDFGVSGKLYPSDRGVAQSSKYIYYDGSGGGGGDFMRTNAAGWGTGSYDFAEMFASSDVLLPGEVVIFGDAKEQVKRSTGATYDQKIAGVVSTRPGFLAGDNLPGQFPIALAGRVPTGVTTENGTIAIGDPLTTSSRPGYAMKATEPGPIIGYATETFVGDTGDIIVFINPSYYDGGPVEEGPAAENVVSGFAAQISSFDVSGALNLNGGSILSVAMLQGIGNIWRLEEDGDFVTQGRLVQLIRSHQNEDVETYAAATREMTVQLSGTSMLENGRVIVDFEQIDPKFNDIIALGVPYRVLVTPYGATGQLHVAERTQAGFAIVESGSMSQDVSVDWLVIAYHKDYAPEPEVEIPEVIEEQESEVTEPEVEPVVEPVDEVVVEEAPTTEAAPEQTTEIVEEAPSTDIPSTEEEPTVTIEPESIVE